MFETRPMVCEKSSFSIDNITEKIMQKQMKGKNSKTKIWLSKLHIWEEVIQHVLKEKADKCSL